MFLENKVEMNFQFSYKILIIWFLVLGCKGNVFGQSQYPFLDPTLQVEKRIDNLLSILTLDEKINCLGTNPTIERIGLKGTGHVEGLHGLAMGLPGGWGRKTPVPTTTFPQSIGMAETWDPELLQQAAAIESSETRYLFQSEKYHKGGLIVRAPNADLGRDPRRDWGGHRREAQCRAHTVGFHRRRGPGARRALPRRHDVRDLPVIIPSRA